MGAAAKEEGRRKVGPADPETRRRIIRKEMGLDKPPAETKPLEREVPAETKAPRTTTTTDAMTGGVDKLLKPKANIERRLAEMGE